MLDDVKSLDPWLTNDGTSSDVQNLLYNARLAYAEPATGLPAPNFRVVDSVKVSDDKLIYTFTLKDGIKWSDGQAITAEDYAWSFVQAAKPENKWPYRADYVEYVEAITALDNRTVQVQFKAPLIYAIGLLAREPLPKHIWEGKSWTDPALNPEIDKPTVVSGPWKLKEWKRGQYISLERNTASTIFPVPYADGVTFQVINQPTLWLQKLKTGDLDVITVAPADYAEAKKVPNVTFNEVYGAHWSYSYIGINFRKPYLQDQVLRQALAYATPQKEIIDKIYFGLGQPIYAGVPLNHPTYNPNTPHYDFNLDKAKQLLSGAGYKIEGGKLKDKSGKELPKMKILTNSGNREREAIMGVVQNSWKELGIELEPQTFDFQTYLKTLKTEPFDYDFFVLGWQADADDIESWDGAWRAIPDQNAGAWNTEVTQQVLDLFGKVRKEFDFDKRKELMAQIQVLTATDLPYIYLAQTKNVMAVLNKWNTPYNALSGANAYTDWSLK
jgi:peptide/nickel transport system substrate-binding protein